MKPSEAMLRGFEMAGGNQCTRVLCEGKTNAPTAVCANGAILLGSGGDVHWHTVGSVLVTQASRAFFKSTDLDIIRANNGDYPEQTEPMPIDMIAGILSAEGL